MVRERAQLPSSTAPRQSLPSSSQHVFTGPDLGSKAQGIGQDTSSGFSDRTPATGQSKAPGQGLAAVALGENTRQATHDRLTTEPAKDPFNKDISTLIALTCRATLLMSLHLLSQVVFCHQRLFVCVLTSRMLWYEMQISVQQETARLPKTMEYLDLVQNWSSVVLSQ